jgi:hypothetical protein
MQIFRVPGVLRGLFSENQKPPGYAINFHVGGAKIFMASVCSDTHHCNFHAVASIDFATYQSGMRQLGNPFAPHGACIAHCCANLGRIAAKSRHFRWYE